MPTESELRAKPNERFSYGHAELWYDPDEDAFCVATDSAQMDWPSYAAMVDSFGPFM